MKPVIRLLAAIPGVLYGLIGILVLVPFVGKHLITRPRRTRSST
jgi:phosphate transport system permease protein